MYRFYETFPSLFFHPWSFHHSIKRKCLMSPFKKISEIFTYTWKCVYDRKIYIAENGMNIFPKRGFKEMLAQKNIVPWRAQKVPPPHPYTNSLLAKMSLFRELLIYVQWRSGGEMRLAPSSLDPVGIMTGSKKIEFSHSFHFPPPPPIYPLVRL